MLYLECGSEKPLVGGNLDLPAGSEVNGNNNAFIKRMWNEQPLQTVVKFM